MRSTFRVLGASVLTFLVAAACSGSSGEHRSGGDGAKSGGDAGATSGSGGASGSSTGGVATGGSGTSGSSGSATGGGSGVAGSGQSGSSGAAGSSAGGAAGSSTGGAAGSSAGADGRSGGGGSTACSRDDDCVVASTYSTTGCCSRGCGVALNGDWVANEPCASADLMTDPVPSSCSTGCLQCPQDPRCEKVYEAICLAGTCTAVTDYGPCTVDDDCILAIDYESTLGACCDCPRMASRATLEHADCIVPVSDPKPQGCDPSPANACATTTCPTTCSTPMNLRCNAGRCVSG